MTETRVIMTRQTMDRKCDEFEHMFPDMSCNSARRRPERNDRVGGHENSKHLFGMARDYVLERLDEETDAELVERYRGPLANARSMGFWALIEVKEEIIHLHLQGIAPGPIPGLWLEIHREIIRGVVKT